MVAGFLISGAFVAALLGAGGNGIGGGNALAIPVEEAVEAGFDAGQVGSLLVEFVVDAGLGELAEEIGEIVAEIPGGVVAFLVEARGREEHAEKALGVEVGIVLSHEIVFLHNAQQHEVELLYLAAGNGVEAEVGI